MGETENMSRKELLQPNKVEKFLYSFVDHAYRKKNLYTIISVIFICLIISIWGIWQYVKIERINEANLLHIARSKFKDPKLTEKERLIQGIVALQEFTSSESESKLSVYALMELGEAHARNSQINESINVFRKVINHSEATQFLRNSAKLSLAAIYEQKKQWDQAQKFLDSIDTESWNDLRWRVSARIAINKGEFKKAKKLLERLLKEFPNSVFQQETEVLLLSL